MDYINTSHPNFLGGAKAVEVASQNIKSSRSSVSIPKIKVPFKAHLTAELLYVLLIFTPIT